MTSDSRKRDVGSKIAVAETELQQITNDDDEINRWIFPDESDVVMHESNQQDKLNSSSSSFRSKVVKVESSLYQMESDSAMSSDYIQEKPLEQMAEIDSIKDNSSDIGVFLLQPSPQTEDFKSIYPILKQLLATNLIVVCEGQDYIKLLQKFELSLIVLLPSTDDDKLILEKLCSLTSPPLIYLLGSQPNTSDEKQAFFTKYSSICAMLKDPKELAIKVALDFALQSRTRADYYSRNNNKDCANKMFDRNIELLNQLNGLAQRNMDNENWRKEK
jgi:hypothetical protein